MTHYEHNGIKLYLGDWRDTLADVECDAVITDPPYDVATHAGGRFAASVEFGNVDFPPLPEIAIASLAGELINMAKRWVIIFCPVEWLGKIRDAVGDAYIRGGIWDRVQNSPQISGDRPAQAVEGIAVLHRVCKKRWNGGGKAGIWRHTTERGHKVHPTQKPLLLMRELVRQFSDPGEVILDPFAGSATTLIAAAIEGRQAIGTEIDPETYKIAVNRIERGFTPDMFRGA